MRRANAAQLAFDFLEAAPATPFEPTRVLRRHRGCNNLLKRLAYVRRYFPELDGYRIRVGLTRVASGMAVPGGYELWFNPREVSYHTIAHEFVHLLQRQHGVPSGERSCDIYSLARHWTLNDAAPYYVRIPRRMYDDDGNIEPEDAKLIYDVAAQALDLRRSGLRNYIAFFERTLSDELSRRIGDNSLRKRIGLPGKKPVSTG